MVVLALSVLTACGGDDTRDGGATSPSSGTSEASTSSAAGEADGPDARISEIADALGCTTVTTLDPVVATERLLTCALPGGEEARLATFASAQDQDTYVELQTKTGSPARAEPAAEHPVL